MPAIAHTIPSGIARRPADLSASAAFGWGGLELIDSR